LPLIFDNFIDDAKSREESQITSLASRSLGLHLQQAAQQLNL